MGREEEFAERLVRIETKVDMLIDNNKTANAQRKELESRVEDIEKKLNVFVGALIAANFLLIFFAPQIRALFLGK